MSDKQVPQIGVDPDLFDAFYSEHLEDLQRFVARRVGDRKGSRPDRRHLPRRDRLGPPLPTARHAEGMALWNRPSRRCRGPAPGRSRARPAGAAPQTALLDEEEAARIEARIDAAARSRRLYEAMDCLSEDEQAYWNS